MNVIGAVLWLIIQFNLKACWIRGNSNIYFIRENLNVFCVG